MNKLKKDGRKLRSESTADHILNTAIKIARKGNIDNMSFNSIAKEANIGTRTIFRHFKDQEALQENLDQKLEEEFVNSFSTINGDDNLENRIKSKLDVKQYTPSVGQGALGIEILKNKSELKEFLDFLNDEQTQIQVEAERKISKTLAGSCTVPMGAHASIKNNLLTIQAFVSSPDGIKMIRANDTGPYTEHLLLANNVAQSLIDQGAKNILGLEHG